MCARAKMMAVYSSMCTYIVDDDDDCVILGTNEFAMRTRDEFVLSRDDQQRVNII